MVKDFVRYTIYSVVLIHLLLLVMGEISWPVACWGILMQGLYFQFLEEFPHINMNSMLFYTAAGKN